MARKKRAPRHRRSATRRSLNFWLRDRYVAAIALSVMANLIPPYSGGRAVSVSAGCASEGIAEAVQEETLPHRPVEERTRLIRIRIHRLRKVLYSADDPTGVVAAKTSRTPIRFGGALTDYDSNIVLSSSEDLVYFDKIPAFTKLGLLGMLSTSASTPSNMERVALNICQLPSTSFQSIVCTLDNDALSGLLLVVTNDNIRDLVRDAKTDKWGFREVPEDGLRELQPTLYYKGLRAVESFNNILEGGEMEYMFVFDWGCYGKE